MPAVKRSPYEEFQSCELPKTNYMTNNSVALGQGYLNYLGNLKFNPGLCGHVLVINCGNGKWDVLVTDSDYGSGLNFYESSWNKVTNNFSDWLTKCSVQLSEKSSLNFEGYRCFHYYSRDANYRHNRNFALLNTKDRIVTGATIGSSVGRRQSSQIYFRFDDLDQSISDLKVKFSFKDGGWHEVLLTHCLNGSEKQRWN